MWGIAFKNFGNSVILPPSSYVIIKGYKEDDDDEAAVHLDGVAVSICAACFNVRMDYRVKLD